MEGAKYVVDLLDRKFDIDAVRGTATGLPDDFDASEGDPLADRRAEVEKVRAELARDPQGVVDRFRDFYHEPDLTADDLLEFLDAWTFAVDSPDAFATSIDSGLDSFGIGNWFDRVRAYLHMPKDVSDADNKVLAELRRRYEVPGDVAINPNVRQFETLDPAWVRLAFAYLAEKRGTWPDLQPFRHHDTAPSGSNYVYPSTLDYGTDGIRVGFFSDFGTGYYHSLLIAKQLERARHPYVFHLGDVYYAGREDEFREYFTKPLENVVAQSRFFGLAENHELYSGGLHYRRYFDNLLAAQPVRAQQEGSYFCVTFQHHQIVGIDVNWNGRQTFVDTKSRDWLASVMQNAGNRTTILLTGSAPYTYGSPDRTHLLGDLWDFVRSGQVHLWFWGDDHYCALFSRHDLLAPFIGSCIGHGGFPGTKRKAGGKCWVDPLWVEDEPRFPEWTNLHQDAGNNGWCDATLLADGSVELTYVDWLGARRHQVTLSRDGNLLRPSIVKTFGGRSLRETVPVLHR